MPRWDNHGLQARFMVICSLSLLAIAIGTLLVVAWFELSGLESKLRLFAENELGSLKSLVESTMVQRVDDQQNVAIKVFNGWFDGRNRDYPGKLWSVWSPKVRAHMAQATPDQPAKLPRDAIDEEALRTGQPVGRLVGETYRYSLPIILGDVAASRKATCMACHGAGMGLNEGEVIAVFSSSLSTADDMAALRRMLLLMSGGALLAMLIVMLGIRLIFGRVITRPMAAMTTAMGKLADGDFDVVLPGLKRKDEVGAMARSVEGFKVKAAEKAYLEAEERHARERAAAAEKTAAAQRGAMERQAAAEREEAARKDAIHKLANAFETAVGSIVDSVSSASTELEAAADNLTGTADTTRQLSTAVASASHQASANVQSVASATEQMAASIDEINRHVHESSTIAQQAVKQAERTDRRINELSNAASRIGDIVKLITSVADQTNLLALNATIEAARAGETGKGFAVVAQEVKTLAAQTAKATKEISAQVAGMQAATQESVLSIKEIAETIGTISEIASTIAAAVEEQGAATREISRNVSEAAKGTVQVATNITDVDRGAGETGAASAQVLASAQSLSDESARLKVEVDIFLASVRTGPADRRKSADPDYAGPERRAHVPHDRVDTGRPSNRLARSA